MNFLVKYHQDIQHERGVNMLLIAQAEYQRAVLSQHIEMKHKDLFEGSQGQVHLQCTHFC